MGGTQRYGRKPYTQGWKARTPSPPQRGNWTPADLSQAMFVKDMVRGEHIEVWPHENRWLAGFVIVACRDEITSEDSARPRYLAHVWGDTFHQIPRSSNDPERQLAFLQAEEMVRDLPEARQRLQDFRDGGGSPQPLAREGASTMEDAGEVQQEPWREETIMGGYMTICVPDSFRLLTDTGTAAFFSGPDGQATTHQSLQVFRGDAD